MKKAKKVVALLMCAVLLVVGSVTGTMAYLTSQDSVTNTFTVGNVAITLDELDVDNDTNTTDNVTYGEGESAVVRDKANSYKLLPGKTYTKDPTIHVDANSENCFLFVTVENGIAGIEATGEATVAAQMTAKGWKEVTNATNTYVYVGTAEGATAPSAVSAGADVVVFESFKIRDNVTNEELNGTPAAGSQEAVKGYADKTITVTAYAIQAEGFDGKTAAEIWDAAPSAWKPTTQGAE